MNAASTEPGPLTEHIHRIPVNSSAIPTGYTNNYLIHDQREAILFDTGYTGPASWSRLGSTLAQLGIRKVTMILISHPHPDHLDGLDLAVQATGAPVFCHPASRLEVSKSGFHPQLIDEGQQLQAGSTSLDVLYQPGHHPGMINLWQDQGRVLLAADNVTGQGSVAIPATNGNMKEYLDGLHRLRRLQPHLIGCGHGQSITGRRECQQHLTSMIERRMRRETQLISTLAKYPGQTVETLTQELYSKLAPGVLPMAQSTLLAHLHKLMDEGTVRREGRPGRYYLSD